MSEPALEEPDPTGTQVPHSGPGAPEDLIPGSEEPSPATKSVGGPGLGPTRPDPDLGLIDQVLGGQKEAFNELVERHQDRVYTRIYFMVRDRELAADLAQEAFLKAYQNLSGFRGEALFSTWLAKIALNVTLHSFEKKRAQKRSGRVMSIHAVKGFDGEASEFEIPDSTHDPAAWAERNETQRAILAAINELDDEYRIALVLRELHGYSYQDIAIELDVALGTVKSKIHRARQSLQEKLKDIAP